MKIRIIHGRFIMTSKEAWRFALIKTVIELGGGNLSTNTPVSVEPYTDKLHDLEGYESDKFFQKPTHN